MLEHHEHKHPTHEFDGIIENRENSPPPYFTVLFYGLILWGVAFIAYFLLSGWSSEGEFTEKMASYQARQASQPVAESSAPAAAIDAAALYAANCAVCHAADGKGGIGPDLTGATYKYGKSAQEIHASISSGRPGGMPAFGSQLSEAEIEALAAYLLGL